MKNGTLSWRTRFATLIFLFLALSFPALTQSYQPIIASDSTSWDMAHPELFGIVMEQLYTIKYPDSTYSKLFTIGLFPDTNYVGKIREDAINGKIWYCDIFNSSEKLIMDMALEIGDTFEIIPGIGSEVDSVFYNEGRKTIRFNLQTIWDEPVMFIEGVGPNIGVFYPADDFDRHYAACKYDMDNLVYVNNNNNFNDCVPNPVGIIDKPKTNNPRIYPIPTASLLLVEMPSNSQTKTVIKIADISGKVLLSEVFFDNNYAINITSFSPGYYIVNLTTIDKYHQQIILITK